MACAGESAGGAVAVLRRVMIWPRVVSAACAVRISAMTGSCRRMVMTGTVGRACGETQVRAEDICARVRASA
eukprot:42259-Eustigmatos_ZCMA.PRE.1